MPDHSWKNNALTILRGLEWFTCLCYLDNVIAFSSIIEEHLERLPEVLTCFRRASFQLNTKKCCFGAHGLCLLGHLVYSTGVCTDLYKIKAILNFPRSKTVNDLRSFLDLWLCFWCFIERFAIILQPLILTAVGWRTLHLGTWSRNSLLVLRVTVTNDPVLLHFKERAPTDIHTNASSFGLGALLA